MRAARIDGELDDFRGVWTFQQELFPRLQRICRRGRWDGLDYLHRWERIWFDPRVGDWIAAVKEQRLPGANAEQSIASHRVFQHARWAE